MVIECFEKVLHSDFISEIIIVDDASKDSSYSLLLNHFKYESKVKVYQNLFNLDCYFNKKRAVELATNEWVAIIDSDNVIDEIYLAAIFDSKWDEKTILAPTFAYPTFDYRQFEGLTISKENVADYMEEPMFETALNTFNFFINRNEYLKVWDGSINPVTSDSIYFNYCWLKAGNKIHFTKDLQYFHAVHSGSHYQNKNHLTPIGFHQSILNNLRELK